MSVTYYYVEREGMRLAALILDGKGFSVSWEDVSPHPEPAGRWGAQCGSVERAELVAQLVGGNVVQYEDDGMGPPLRARS